MNRSLQRMLLVGMATAVLGTVLVGCNSTPAAPTKEEAASFKGGPMPPEARKKMQEAIDAAHNKAAQSSSQPHAQ
jgi:uncharacterized membrane protein